MDGGLTTAQTLELVARAVPDIARRAVPVPEIRLGVVAATQSGVTVSVLVDGDLEPADVLSGVPQLLTQGQRVVVNFYPPHGAVVLGVLTIPGNAVVASTTEQFWKITDSHIASGSIVDATGVPWVQQDSAGVGWTHTAAVDLTCDIAGLWEVGLQTVWSLGGTGTMRAAGLVIDRALYATAAAAPKIVQATTQFGATPANTLSGWGFWIYGTAVYTFEAGDVISPIAKQDSGATLDLDLIVDLRLLEATG